MNPVASLFSQEIPILIGAAIFVLVAKFRFERRKISIEVSEEALAINDVVSSHECQIPAAQRTMPRSLPVDFREIFPVLNDNARFVPLLYRQRRFTKTRSHNVAYLRKADYRRQASKRRF